MKKTTDDLKDFARLSEKSFVFWGDSAEDVYQRFYKGKSNGVKPLTRHALGSLTLF